MKNVSQVTLSKLVFSFFLALLLAGPVFGNEAAPAETSETKVEKKAEKKGKRRHKHNKKEDKKVEQAPVTPAADAPAPEVEEKK